MILNPLPMCSSTWVTSIAKHQRKIDSRALRYKDDDYTKYSLRRVTNWVWSLLELYLLLRIQTKTRLPISSGLIFLPPWYRSWWWYWYFWSWLVADFWTALPKTCKDLKEEERLGPCYSDDKEVSQFRWWPNFNDLADNLKKNTSTLHPLKQVSYVSKWIICVPHSATCGCNIM